MILEQVQQILSTGKGHSLSELADRLPDLCGRDDAKDILYLLLRLDTRFENVGKLWFAKAGMKSDSTLEIREAVKGYFSQTNRKGELMAHLTKAVAESTSIGEDKIQKVISKNYHTVQSGKMVLNRVKENENG
ncbi:Uncharacterized protein dnl_06470 [Desulfonema limicola]|uniref:Uncharacterized protein n=1 Tax=Desulfonema limicola TaxID=45656 RepID=A0A975B452_9BACT|nr:hypothetical protein [Desulfonema limicola]QTA78426.1 Uncharacterized protein dnl_06470 [Desulfonema limicola]